MEGGTIGDTDLLGRGLWYGWNQSILSIEHPVDAISLEDMGQRFASGTNVQPQLAGAHAHLSVHVLGILNHALGVHSPNRDSVTPNSLLRAIKL